MTTQCSVDTPCATCSKASESDLPCMRGPLSDLMWKIFPGRNLVGFDEQNVVNIITQVISLQCSAHLRQNLRISH